MGTYGERARWRLRLTEVIADAVKYTCCACAVDFCADSVDVFVLLVELGSTISSELVWEKIQGHFVLACVAA